MNLNEEKKNQENKNDKESNYNEMNNVCCLLFLFLEWPLF